MKSSMTKLCQIFAMVLMAVPLVHAMNTMRGSEQAAIIVDRNSTSLTDRQLKHEHHSSRLHHHDQKHRIPHFDQSDPDPREPCGARISPQEDRMMDEAQEAWEKENSERAHRLRQGRELYSAEIQVYFHVITGNTDQLSRLHRDAIMDRLNDAFAPSGFSFAYAGYTSTPDGVNGAVSSCTQGNLEKFTKYIRRGTASTLNIIVCDTTRGGTTLQMGFATSPPGVIAGFLDYDVIGIAHPRSKGVSLVDTTESAVHEAGHWLGLKHTFASPPGSSAKGGCDTNQIVEENGLYRLVNDGVTDTPAHFTYTIKEECAYTTCCLDNNGVSTLNTCPYLPGRDPVTNFMNYLSSSCSAKIGEFTPGQIARMIAEYETFRSPSRTLNCGCPKSCTADILETTAFAADGRTYTCRDDILDAISYYGNELSGCWSTGDIYPACANCNSRVCASLAPDPTQSPKHDRTDHDALPVSLCAKRIKNICDCSGDLKCKNRKIVRKCFPPSDLMTYRNAVFKELKSLCH